MEAGRELDALVAEKVMGWTALQQHPNPQMLGNLFNLLTGETIKPHGGPWYYPPGYPLHGNGVAFPEYSTDIAAAWQVVEQIDDRIINSPGDGTDGLPSGLLPLMLVHLGTSGWAARFSDSIDDDRIPVSVASPWWDRTDEIPTAASAKTAPLAICLAALKVLGVEGESDEVRGLPD